MVSDDLSQYEEAVSSPILVALSRPTRLTFPRTQEAFPRWWFEFPPALAFGGVYNNALDLVLGTYDHRWTPGNPFDGMGGYDESRDVFVSARHSSDTVYLATIHHLFEISV